MDSYQVVEIYAKCIAVVEASPSKGETVGCPVREGT